MELVPKKQLTIERLKDLVYPIILVVFICSIIASFFFIAQFLSKSVDSAISSPNEAQIQAQLTYVNVDNYNAISKKIHLPQIQASAPIVQEVIPTEGATTSPVIVEQPGTESKKETFSVSVLNSTKKAGLATTVKNDLITAGFTIIKTGNTSPQETQTIVQIKEHVQASSAIVEEILTTLSKRFLVGDPQILEESASYDIVITVGTAVAQ